MSKFTRLKNCHENCCACCLMFEFPPMEIPGMPEGKPAGTRCINLTSNNLCKLHGSKDKPPVYTSFVQKLNLAEIVPLMRYLILQLFK